MNWRPVFRYSCGTAECSVAPSRLRCTGTALTGSING